MICHKPRIISRLISVPCSGIQLFSRLFIGARGKRIAPLYLGTRAIGCLLFGLSLFVGVVSQANAQNIGPAVDAGDAQTVVEGQLVSLSGSATDPEGETSLTFAWTQTGGTDVTLANPATATATFTAPSGLTTTAALTFLLTVTDPVGGFGSGAVVITVTAGTTVPAGAPAQVTNFQAQEIRARPGRGAGATLTWDALTGSVTGFDLQRRIQADNYGTTIYQSLSAGNPVRTGYNDSDVPPGIYFYRVRAVNASGAGPWSTESSPTVSSPPDVVPSDVQNLTITEIPNEGGLSVAWEEPATRGNAFIGYNIVRTDDGSSNRIFQSVGEAVTTYIDTNVIRGVTYTYRIDAVNTTGVSSVVMTYRLSLLPELSTANLISIGGRNQRYRVNQPVDVTLPSARGGDEPLVIVLASVPTGLTFDAATRVLSGTPTVKMAAVDVNYTVTDADGDVDTQVLNIAVLDDRPVSMPSAPGVVDENQRVTLDGSNSVDPEGLALTYAWRQTSGTTVSLTDADTVMATFTAPSRLVRDVTLVFELVVTDQGGQTGSRRVGIKVDMKIALTVANAGANQSVNEGMLVTLNGSGSSDDGPPMNYLWEQTGGTPVSLTDANTATATFTAPNQVATNIRLFFQLSAGFPGGVVARDQVAITVTAGADDPPTANAGVAQTVDEDTTVTLDGSASSDPEGRALEYQWTQVGGTAAQQVRLSSLLSRASPTFTAPNLVANADLNFSLVVTDPSGMSSLPSTVTITVRANNDPPVADAGADQAVDVGEQVTLNGTGSRDPEGQTLSYVWEQFSSTSATLENPVSLTNETTATPTFTASNADITLFFRLTVNDGTNASSRVESVRITVRSSVTDVLIADAGDAQIVNEGGFVTLNGRDSRAPAGQDLTYQWEQVSDPSVSLTDANTVSLADTSTVRSTFVAPDDLVEDIELTFQLTVTAGTESETAMVIITVRAGPNNAPTVDAGDAQTVNENSPVSLDGSGSDPEGEDLDYRWTQVGGTPNEQVDLSDSTAANPTFTAPNVARDAVLTFSLVVTDARGMSSRAASVRVTVRFLSDDAPIANAGSAQTMREGQTVTLDGSGSSDPDGDRLNYQWTQVGGTSDEQADLSSLAAANPTFTAPNLRADANLTFNLVVTAGGVSSAPASVVITVQAVNEGPVANVDVAQSVDEDTEVTLDGSGSRDPEGNALIYEWRQAGGTVAEQVSLSDPAIASPTFTAPNLLTDANLSFRLVVTDEVGISGLAEVEITVVADNDAPEARIRPRRQTVDEGATVTLDGTRSRDPESGPFTYQWTQTGGPTVFLFVPSAASPTFTAPQYMATDARLTFELVVTDSSGLASAPDSGVITVGNVGANETPTADAGSPPTEPDPDDLDSGDRFIPTEGDLVTLDGSGSSDPEGESLIYAWTQIGGTPTVSLSDATAESPTFTAPGSLTTESSLLLTFSLTVTDESGNVSTADTVVVSLTQINDVPIADAGSAQTVAENTTVTLNGTASSDPEAQTLTYQWEQMGTPTVTLNDATAASPTFTTPQVLNDTVLSFRLMVNDGVQNSSPSTVLITLTAGTNDAPTANAGNPQTVDEGDLVTLTGRGSDPERQPLTFAWTQTGTESRVTLANPNTAQQTFTAPQFVNNTTLTFSLTVNDGIQDSAADEVVITVTAGINNPPIANAGSDQSVMEGDTVNLTGAASSDPEDETLTYRWTQIGEPAVNLDNATSATPQFTAPSSQLLVSTMLIFELVVRDASGNDSLSDRVSITVAAGLNDPPTANAGDPQTVAEGATVLLNGRGSSDPEGDTLTYSWTQNGGPTVTLANATTARPDFSAPVQLAMNTTLTFSLTVNDGNMDSASASNVVITVTAGTNDRPTADAGNPQTVDEGVTVTLDASGSSDPEGEALTYQWTQEGGMSVSLVDATTSTPEFTAPSELVSNITLAFTLVVTDTRGESSLSDGVRITVTAGANDPPTSNAGADRTVQEGDEVTLNGSGSDPESPTSALTYSWRQTGGGNTAVIDLIGADTATPRFTAPNLLSNLNLGFALTITDEGGARSAADAVLIRVEANNDGPTANAGNPQTVDEGDTATLDGSGSSDPENQNLTYAWTQSGGVPNVTLNSNTAQSPSFTAPEILTSVVLTFSLTVSDGTNTSAAASVEVTVRADNDAPTATISGTNRTVNEASLVTLTGSGSDPEGQPLTFSWNQGGSEQAVNLQNPTTTTTTFTAPVPAAAADTASLTFTLIVSDGGRNSAPANVVVTVNAVNDAPVAVVGDAQTVDAGATVTLDASGSSDQEGPLTYLWEQVSGSTVLLTSINTATTTFTAPGPTNDVNFQFRLTVTDEDDVSDSDTVTVTVRTTANEFPIANAGPAQYVQEGAVVNLDGSGSSDPENQTLTYGWTVGFNTATPDVTLIGENTATPSFTAPTGLSADAMYVLELTVADPSNREATANAFVTVVAGPNTAPVANAGARQTVLPGATVRLNGFGSSDPERNRLTYAWSQTGGTTVNLSNVTVGSPTFTAPMVSVDSTFTFGLTVNDGSANSTQASTVVSVEPNGAPIALVGDDRTEDKGVLVTLDGSGSSDPEGERLTFAWTQTSGAIVTLSRPTRSSPTFTTPASLAMNEVFVFSLTVTDTVGQEATDTVTITVPASDAPIANAGRRQIVPRNALATLDGTGSSDPEGDDADLMFMWEQISTPLVALTMDVNTGIATFIPSDRLPDDVVLTFMLTATAPSGLMGTDTVIVAIANGPRANAGPNQRVDEGVEVTLEGTGKDPEVSTLAWEQIGGTPMVDLSITPTIPTVDSSTTPPVRTSTSVLTFTAPTRATPEDEELTFRLTFQLTVTVGGVKGLDEVIVSDRGVVVEDIALLSEAILPEVTQAMSASSTGAITRRIELSANPVSPPSLNFGDLNLGDQGSLAGVLQTHGEAMSEGDRAFKELLSGANFVLPMNASNGEASGGSSPAFWGSGEYRELSGDSGTLNWEGELSGIHLGFDARVNPDFLAGVSVSWLRGDFSYDGATGLATDLDAAQDEGDYDIDLTSVNPYIGWKTGSLDLWATVGYGEGELEIEVAGDVLRVSDLNLQTIGIGGSSELWQMGLTDVRLKGELSYTELEIEGSREVDAEIAAQDVDAIRVRISVESKQSHTLASGALYQPSVEVGLRYDGGDGETGGGGEIGGGLLYSNPATRVTLEGRARALLGSGGNYKEWGISGSLRLQPGADGQGLSLTITPGYGESQSGIQAFFDATNKADTATADPRAYIDARIGYGLSLRHWNAVLTPYTELTLGTTDSYRLGLNWKFGTRYNLTLSGEHQTGTTPSQAILLKGEMNF